MTADAQGLTAAARLWQKYRLRWRRRRFLLRALSKSRQLRPVQDRTRSIHPDDILGAMTVRNESARLPYFLAHHRRLGVRHFLVVDNASTDGTAEYLAAQPDVSLWTTSHSYKAARFGLDWLTAIMARHAHGHWCVTLDADELLIYPYWETRDLSVLTSWLEAQGLEMMGALMLDMYPEGPLDSATYNPGDDPIATLGWYDGGNYSVQVQPKMQNLWIQGGPRARMFFAEDPRRAPTLNKIPLVKWNRRFAYVNSTHAVLPARLNLVYDVSGGEVISGVLLHTKFLPEVVAKSAEEKARREHFANSTLYDSYYDRLTAAPTLWCAASRRYSGWRQLEAEGLMSRGGWV